MSGYKKIWQVMLIFREDQIIGNGCELSIKGSVKHKRNKPQLCQ